MVGTGSGRVETGSEAPTRIPQALPGAGPAGQADIALTSTIIRALGAASGYGSFVSPDGQHVAAACGDGSVRIWPVDPLPAAIARRPRELTDEERTRVKAVYITVDPERDTPARLREYAAQMHAQPDGWRWLTGEST